ncbi:hypothetical protein X975_09619, partial [Stegodyphus mimosarum]
MDRLFWGYLKSRVYYCNPQTLLDLKDSIPREIANIPHAMLRQAVLSTTSRCNAYLAVMAPMWKTFDLNKDILLSDTCCHQ